jgi:hypothetical protein
MTFVTGLFMALPTDGDGGPAASAPLTPPSRHHVVRPVMSNVRMRVRRCTRTVRWEAITPT